mmetsp:Transcript_76988/g.214011  ORF Transcript_76988/g.214011 Transcript_76988/m.214011 type:complete len:423 (-) Transcript_76988:104-1372(-)
MLEPNKRQKVEQWPFSQVAQVPPVPQVPQVTAPATWITLGDREAASELGDLPPRAPVVVYDPLFEELLASAHYILSELVAPLDVSEDVVMRLAEWSDAGGWMVFPRVGEALARHQVESYGFCVAACRSKVKWGVGSAGRRFNDKKRELSAKLALAVALASHSVRLMKVVDEYPGFAQLCGIGAPLVLQPSLPITWLDVGPGASKLTELGLPREGPFAFYDDLPEKMARLAPTLIKNSLGGKVDGGVSYHHDPRYKGEDAGTYMYPEVAKALKKAGREEDAYCIAVCQARGKWAVGLATGWKRRETAARVALVATLAPENLEPEAMAQLNDPSSPSQFLFGGTIPLAAAAHLTAVDISWMTNPMQSLLALSVDSTALDIFMYQLTHEQRTQVIAFGPPVSPEGTPTAVLMARMRAVMGASPGT